MTIIYAGRRLVENKSKHITRLSGVVPMRQDVRSCNVELVDLL